MGVVVDIDTLIGRPVGERRDVGRHHRQEAAVAFQVALDGSALTTFATDKVRALLAYLAVESGRPHRREALAALLWPNCPKSAARTNLRQALYRLRRALTDHQATHPHLLVTAKAV